MNKMEVIAEIGQAHDGSLGILYSYIDALADVGVDTIKFQVHIADAESSEAEPFRVPFSYEDNLRLDYWRRMEFSVEQWSAIRKHCITKGVNFLASPFSIAAVDLLESIGVERYKIGSGEVTNKLMLEKIARTGKPLILSSGMSSFREVDEALGVIRAHHNEVSILQCTTSYPTPPERLGFNVLSEMKARYENYKVGLSEHSARIETGLAAFIMGAEILEFHVVFDRRMFGPDAASSLTIDEVRGLVDGINFLTKAVNSQVDKDDLDEYSELKPIFEKSLALNKDLKKGHVLEFDDLETKKPARMGIPASKYEGVIGKKLANDMKKYSFLNESDLS